MRVEFPYIAGKPLSTSTHSHTFPFRNLVSVLLFLSTCCAAQPDAFDRYKRTTGETVQVGSNPAIAFLQFINRSGFVSWCTSTLIQPDTLLTSKVCADSANKGFSASVEFRNAAGRPKYNVKSAIPQSLLQAGTQNELGLIILDKAVEGIMPVPVNGTLPALQADSNVTFFGYQETHAPGELGDSSSFVGLMRSDTQISPDGCSIIDDQAMNSSVFCVVSAEEEQVIPGACAEDRGGPFFTSTGTLAGVLTNSTHCASADNELLAVTPAAEDNQEFILTQGGWLGGQSWSLVPGDGFRTPRGRYGHHCIASIEGQCYTGVFVDDQERGCLIFREHTACLTDRFSHVVGTVPAIWTVASTKNSARAMNFAGSDQSIPCVLGDFSGNVFGGRWNSLSEECEIHDASSGLISCDLLSDTTANTNLEKMPVSSNVGLLIPFALPDNSRFTTLEKILMGVSSGVTLISSIEFFIITAMCCALYSRNKQKVAAISGTSSPEIPMSVVAASASAATKRVRFVDELVKQFEPK